MQTSKIIEWNGEFIGAAIMLPERQGWQFVSANHRADGANGCTASTLDEMQAVARRAFLVARIETRPSLLHQPKIRQGEQAVPF